jgi:hypothetical protein
MSVSDRPAHTPPFGAGSRIALIAISVAALACSGCGAFVNGHRSDATRDVRLKPDAQEVGTPVTPVELQQDVQRFSSDFMVHLSDAGQRNYDDMNPRQRELMLRQMLLYMSNVLDIGTGPYPEINLVDMLVFVSLCRHAFQQHWQPRVFGARGRPVENVFVGAEQQVWTLSNKILSGDQQVQLRELIVAFQRDNPGRHAIEGVRFEQFSSRAGAVDKERAARARGLFGQIRAVGQSADHALLIGERAMFMAQRMPFLVRAHVRLGIQENLRDSLARLSELEQVVARSPELRPMVGDLVTISTNAAAAARETRLLLQPDETGEPGEGLSLGDALAQLDRISARSLALVQELRAAAPEQPEQAVIEIERRVDALARRFALYALLVGVGCAASFWGGYVIVMRWRRRYERVV